MLTVQVELDGRRHFGMLVGVSTSSATIELSQPPPPNTRLVVVVTGRDGVSVPLQARVRPSPCEDDRANLVEVEWTVHDAHGKICIALLVARAQNVKSPRATHF